MEEFYAPNASLRENQSEARVGRDFHAAKERKVFARAKSVRSHCVHPVFINGDFVIIRWIFEFEWLDGTATRIEELAYQRWEGELMAEEQFFYDPAQGIPRKPAT